MKVSTNLIEQLDSIFKPSSIAIVGAGTSSAKWGGRMLTRILASDFRGNIYPVNPKHKEVARQKAYPDIESIDGNVDLVVLCVPAVKIPGLLKDCVKKGVKGAVIVTADFAETGEIGRALENETVSIAREGGLRFIGPNCMGIGLRQWG